MTDNISQALVWAALGCGFTWLMTTAGSAVVFFFRSERRLMHHITLGFAAGVMVAASVWSLLNPAIEQAEDMGLHGWIPAASGFLVGVGFLLALDTLLPHLHAGSDEPEGIRSTWKRTTLLVSAVTLHNIPEGMSVGLLFAMAAQSAGAAGEAPCVAGQRGEPNWNLAAGEVMIYGGGSSILLQRGGIVSISGFLLVNGKEVLTKG